MKYLSILILTATVSGGLNAQPQERYGSHCCGTPAHCKKPGVACIAMCFPGMRDGTGACVTQGDDCTTKEGGKGTAVLHAGKLECRANSELDCRSGCGNKKEGESCRTSSIVRKTGEGHCIGTKDLRQGACVRYKDKQVCLPIIHSQKDEL